MHPARLAALAFVMLVAASCANHATTSMPNNTSAAGAGSGSPTAGSGASANAGTSGMILTGAGGASAGGASSGTGGTGGRGGVGGAAGRASTIGAGGESGMSGTAGSSGASGTGGASSGSAVDCDPRKVLCKRVAPQCPQGQVPSVSGSCYGDCVPVESCPCTEPAACPDANHFTCHMSAAHCGPYV